MATNPFASSRDRVAQLTIKMIGRATKFLELAAPDIYVKGGDYNADTLNAEEREVLRKIGAKIDIVPLEHGYSTSDLLKRLSKLAK